MKSYRVGRGREVDIMVSDATVGRLHAELVSYPDGRFLVRDLHSTNGTFVRAGTGWQRLDNDYVQPDQRLRLGDYETSARELIALSMRQAARQQPEPLGKQRLERNPLTGEIIGRKK